MVLKKEKLVGLKELSITWVKSVSFLLYKDLSKCNDFNMLEIKKASGEEAFSLKTNMWCPRRDSNSYRLASEGF